MQEKSSKAILIAAAVIIIGVGGYGLARWWANRAAESLLAVEKPSPEQIEQIVELLGSPNNELMAAAALRVTELGPQAADALVKHSQRGNARLREMAPKLALEIDVDKGLSAMESVAVSPEREVRLAAVLALSRVETQNERLPGVLRRYAQDADGEISANAAEALAKLPPSEETLEVLQKMANDPDEVRARHGARYLWQANAQKGNRRRR